MTIPEPAGGGGATAYAAAEEPVALQVSLVEDDRTPEGMVCMGSFRGNNLIARCVIPPEMWEQVIEHALFEDPIPVVLVARESPPGLKCQLYALLQLPEELTDEDDDEEEAPWASSVPGSSYEAEVGGNDEDDEDERLVAFPLGEIVRFKKDRVHPDNLPLEAADVLRTLIEGKTTEVVDKALEDLLGR